MQVNNISNQNFCSKVIITPKTMTKLALLKQDNALAAKSLFEDLKTLERNGKADTVIIEEDFEDTNLVLWVFEKVKDKIYRNNMSQPIDFRIGNFKSNVEQCYSRAKKQMVDINKINQSEFDVFTP